MTNKYSKANKNSKKMQHIRYFTIGCIGLLLLAVIAFGLFYSDSTSTEGWVEGVDYSVVEPATRYRSGSPIQVTEYFSYACVHCSNFDPNIEIWSDKLPTDVEFTRSPVVFSPAWALLSRTYLTLEHLDILEKNHSRIFAAIHDQGQQFLSIEMLADFVDGHGASKIEFLAASNSPAVQRRFEKTRKRARDIKITGVPTLVVADKYIIPSSLDRKGMLEAADYLLDKERTARMEKQNNAGLNQKALPGANDKAE